MNRVVLSDEALDELRTLGDPSLQALPKKQRTIDGVYGHRADLPGMVTPDRDKLVVAQQLFRDYTPEIAGALLLAALPQSYATEYGAAVLGAHGQLVDNLTRRIGETARFLLTIMQPGQDTNDDQDRLWNWDKWEDGTGGDNASRLGAPDPSLPWVTCAYLRLFHQMVRDDLDAARKKAPVWPEKDNPIDKLLGEVVPNRS